MGLYKKIFGIPPFLEDAIRRYKYFESGSIERWAMEQLTRGYLDGLKGKYNPNQEKERAGYTLGELGFQKGWLSYLESRKRREENIEQFIIKLEQFVKAIDEIEGRT